VIVLRLYSCPVLFELEQNYFKNPIYLERDLDRLLSRPPRSRLLLLSRPPLPLFPPLLISTLTLRREKYQHGEVSHRGKGGNMTGQLNHGLDSRHTKVHGQVIAPDSPGKTVGKSSQYFHLEWLDGW